MEEKQMIILLKEYKEQANEIAFENLFKSLDKLIQSVSLDFTKGRKIPFEEMYSWLCEVFWRECMNFDENKSFSFKSFIYIRLRTRAIDFIKRKDGKYYESIEYISSSHRNNDDGDGYEVEIASDFDLEEEVLKPKTKKADQRELIDFLVRGENERTTAIVQTYLTTELASPTAIGKHLGLDHKQVSRALEKLSRKYKPQMFGNYEDYLIAL